MNFSRCSATVYAQVRRLLSCAPFLLLLLFPVLSFAQDPDLTTTVPAPSSGGGEANLILPDLSIGTFFGVDGRILLMAGLLICAAGLLFGLMTYRQLRDLPVHKSMKDVSELIWETCKTYLFTQGRFLLILELFIGAIILVYFGYFQAFSALKVLVILAFSLLGIAGSYGVAWYGIRVNTFANSCSASCCSFRAITPGHASSDLRLANRLAPRRCAWRAASLPRLRISAPI
jgi:K(+)-stimulated pyrophosphate-energized sodium pump